MPPTHEPDDYDCPFCRLQHGIHDENNQPGDVVAVTEHAYARISPKWWPGNAGAALVMPRAHHENLYDIPSEVGHAVWDLTQQVAVAMRGTYAARASPPVSIFPRRADDRLYEQHRTTRWVPPEERMPYADTLAAALGLPRTFI